MTSPQPIPKGGTLTADFIRKVPRVAHLVELSSTSGGNSFATFANDRNPRTATSTRSMRPSLRTGLAPGLGMTRDPIAGWYFSHVIN
jgi:hypothetical protein